MNNLTTFEVVAGIASILGLLLVLGTYASRLWRTLKLKQESAEQEFNKEIERLKTAGASVSARTDLGFFVLIELASLRESTTYYRNHLLMYLLFIVIIIGLGLIDIADKPESSDKAIGVCFTIITILGCNCLWLQFLVMRSKKYIRSYERRIKEVWQQAIDKRVKPEDD